MPATKHDLDQLKKLIMANQAESAAQLRAVKAQGTKIAAEIAVLHKEIVDLKAALETGPQVTPELQEAIDAVVASSQALDELNPDAPVVEPPVEPTP